MYGLIITLRRQVSHDAAQINNDQFGYRLSNFPVMLGRSHCSLGIYQYLGELGDIGDYNSLAVVINSDRYTETYDLMKNCRKLKKL